jgi:hypothetical protein
MRARRRKQASPRAPGVRPPWTTNEGEPERRDDTLAYPSQEQRDPGQYLLDSS